MIGCCAPSRGSGSVAGSAERVRAIAGSTAGMVRLDGGAFLMGTESAEGFPLDGEGPVRKVTLDSFYMDVSPVTNGQFLEFAGATGYRTEAERFGWSFVFRGHIPKDRFGELVQGSVAGADWWCRVN